ncbi:LlaJI family restriction endonuclease [Bengtsoniella intestinalis]|uniref:LlaJI family restriction endonuclease n=1 Tax=Bengtsoniella intestinalis TaxID=3073143 RepID=UPI00391F3D5E
MISVFLREQKRYNQAELTQKLCCTEDKSVRILKRLKEYGVLKAVKAEDIQKNLTDLVDEDIEIADVEVGENEHLYVFTFVGVITIEGCVLKCYPKYLLSATEPKSELKQILKVLEKYNSKEQIIRMYNDSSDNSAFNMLAVMLFLLHDYFEHGSYTNTQDIIETNGSGDILWDKSINETFALIYNNRPYYPELFTIKHTNDDYDFFNRLHECILSRCSKELDDADLLDLFDMLGVDLSDEELDDFGDKDYVLDRISKELHIQFNTRKQLLLKTLYAYVANSNTLDDLDCFSMFGTNSFNLVWEKTCADVLDNQLQKQLSALKLPIPLNPEYEAIKQQRLIDLIDKPQWLGTAASGECFKKEAKDTLIPDLVSIIRSEEGYQFIIFDAKYYNLQLEKGKPLRGQPGIESITKQYLYQLAYQQFIKSHGISDVRNCFLMPTEKSEIIAAGEVSLAMLSALDLQDIQIRMIPAKSLFQYYLSNRKMDIQTLHL